MLLQVMGTEGDDSVVGSSNGSDQSSSWSAACTKNLSLPQATIFSGLMFSMDIIFLFIRSYYEILYFRVLYFLWLTRFLLFIHGAATLTSFGVCVGEFYQKFETTYGKTAVSMHRLNDLPVALFKTLPTTRL